MFRLLFRLLCCIAGIVAFALLFPGGVFLLMAIVVGVAGLWYGVVLPAIHAALPVVVLGLMFFVPAWLLIYGFHIPRMPRREASEGPAGAREG